jgi:YHS domain-containing protein
MPTIRYSPTVAVVLRKMSKNVIKMMSKDLLRAFLPVKVLVMCPVCEKASDSEGQQVDVEHGGKTAHLCCEGCANAYNANPDKYSKSEESREEHPKSEHPKKKKERGAGYY